MENGCEWTFWPLYLRRSSLSHDILFSDAFRIAIGFWHLFVFLDGTCDLSSTLCVFPEKSFGKMVLKIITCLINWNAPSLFDWTEPSDVKVSDGVLKACKKVAQLKQKSKRFLLQKNNRIVIYAIRFSHEIIFVFFFICGPFVYSHR